MLGFGLGLASTIGSLEAGSVPGWVAGIDATVDIDFVNDRSWFGGASGDARSRLTVSRASIGYYYDVNGILQQAANNVARLDYDPVSHVRLGLLSEQASNNYCTRSNEFADAAWAKTNTTVTAAALTGPDGLVSASKIEAPLAASASLYRSCASAGSTAGNTGSVYLKKGSGASDASRVYLYSETTSLGLALATLNFDTGVLTVSQGVGTVQALPNGWFRVSVTATSGISAGDNLRLYVGFTSNTPSAGAFSYAFGAQVERNVYATSYMPAVASVSARSNDDIDLLISAFKYNDSAGTILCRARNFGLGAGLVGGPWALHNNTNDTDFSRGYFYNPSPMKMGANAAVGGVSQWDLNATVTVGAFSKMALGWATDNVALSVNGAAATVDPATANPPSGMTHLGIGKGRRNAHYLNGHMDRLTYWPYRKTNAQLVSLSA